jgi:hypothetical protein
VIRIKQTHGAGAPTYHYWDGVTPVSDTPTDFGTSTSDFIPIVEKNESQFALISNFATGRWTTILEDIAAAVNG